MYNAWPLMTPESSGRRKWPCHGQDWDFMGTPVTTVNGTDAEAAKLLQQLIGDFTHNAGTIPEGQALGQVLHALALCVCVCVCVCVPA